MKRNHITIKDVARQLNVSISTVSRAFNDKYDIRPETRDRILKVAKEMGYSPNPLAQHLCQDKSFLVGVIVPEFVNAYFPKVISGMQSALRESNYQLLIMSSNENAKEEKYNLQTLERSMVDGIMISLSQNTMDVSYLKELNERIPIVQFNRVSQKLNTQRILFNDYDMAVVATKHLLEQGYRNIYHVSGPQNLIVSQQRRKAFVNTLKEAGVKDAREHIITGGIFIEDGQQAARTILSMENRPDALFCFNDPLAVGIMGTLRDNGVSVPDDIGVIGFTESRIAPFTYPSLSSIEQPAVEIGITAAKCLLHEIEHDCSEVYNDIVLNGKLNVRASSVRK